SIRSAFAFSACARATLALTRTRLVNRIRSRAARHRGFRIENLAAIDPNLHTDLPKRRPRFGKTVIDVGTERVQRQLSLQVPLAASDFSAVQTPTDLDLDPLRAKPQRLLDGLSHRTSKSDALLELCRNLLGLQLCVQLGFVDLLNRNQHFPSRLRRKVGLQLVDLSSLAADDDSRARGVDDDLQAIGGSLDIHVRYTGAGETLLEIAFELQVLEQKLAKLLLRKPVRMPVFVVAESKTVWMNFLTHNLLQFFSLFAAPCVPRCSYSSVLASSVLAFFFEAFFAAGFSAAAASVFGVARFARGAAAAPPRFRRLLSASFAGLVSSDLAPSADGRSSLLREIVTCQ